MPFFHGEILEFRDFLFNCKGHKSSTMFVFHEGTKRGCIVLADYTNFKSSKITSNFLFLWARLILLKKLIHF